MNNLTEQDDGGATGVLDAVRESLSGVTMTTPVERIESSARGRIRRRRLGTAVAGATLLTGLAVGAGQLYDSPNTPRHSDAARSSSAAAPPMHIVNAAYTIDTQTDGTIHVTWDKARYFTDHTGLADALRRAGFPVLIKVGEFCQGPTDDGKLLAGGVGPGVNAVMTGEDGPDGAVTFVFTPSAMPAGTELFIGYLNQSQLAITHGRPGSIERLVPTSGNLTCSTQVPAVIG